MKTLFIYSLLTAFLSASCGSSKEAATSSNNETTAANTSTANSSNPLAPQTSSAMNNASQEAQKQGSNYRLIISFISIGEGTDPKAREMMDRVLKSWNDKKGKPIEMESFPWGREGEVDFCFKLNELTEKEQSAFVEEMKSAFKDKSLIQIFENQPCMHKR